MEQGGKIYN